METAFQTILTGEWDLSTGADIMIFLGLFIWADYI